MAPAPLAALPAPRTLPGAGAVLELLKPVTWFPPVWAFGCGVVSSGAPLPERYHRLYRLWFAFGFPDFAAVMAIFWLMISRPAITL